MYQFSEIYKVVPFNNGKSIEFRSIKNPSISLTQSQIPKYGVYVWGFKFNEGKSPFMPYYVGMAGGISPNTSINDRLFCHYNFNQHYHIIKQSILPEFNTFLKTDQEINQIAKDCKHGKYNVSQRDILYKQYSANFDYLNKEIDIPTGYGGSVYKTLNRSGKLNPNHQQSQSIQFYQDNFYVCWIDCLVNGTSYNKNVQLDINDLEKYIHTRVKMKNNQKLIGKDISIKDKNILTMLQTKFSNLDTSNLVPNDVFI